MAQECCEVYRVHQDIVDAVRKSMPDEDLICDLGELYKVFGDSTRIKILYVLFQSECASATLHSCSTWGFRQYHISLRCSKISSLYAPAGKEKALYILLRTVMCAR